MSDELDIPSPTYRVPRHRRGMDAGTRRLAIIAGGLGGALVLLVGGWTLLGHRSTGVPVIEADSSPLRVKPENPGGMSVAGSNEEILSDGADGTVGKLAPASETPAPQNMQAAKPPVVASAPPPPAAALPSPAPVAPPVVAAAPLVKPPSPAPVHMAAAEPAHPMGGKGTLVQLAALSSEDAAKVEWGRLEKRMPDLFGKRQPAVSRIEHDGKTFWRLRTGGFSDIAQATAFCEQVRAKGNGCSIAAF
jgi:hypothetical protein